MHTEIKGEEVFRPVGAIAKSKFFFFYFYLYFSFSYLLYCFVLFVDLVYFKEEFYCYIVFIKSLISFILRTFCFVM